MRNLTLLALLIFITSCDSAQKPQKAIPDGMVGLIGYGSLTSQKQMAIQLGKPYEGEVEIVHLEGYQRTWSATTPNEIEFPPKGDLIRCLLKGDSIYPNKLSVLNIRKNDSVAINCCFFIIEEKDLLLLDKTEKGYKRIEVTDKIQEFDVSEGKVWAYQAMEEFTEYPKEDGSYNFVLPNVYLEFLEAGFAELGETYRTEFYQTTLPIPKSVVLECSIVAPPKED